MPSACAPGDWFCYLSLPSQLLKPGCFINKSSTNFIALFWFLCASPKHATKMSKYVDISVHFEWSLIFKKWNRSDMRTGRFSIWYVGIHHNTFYWVFWKLLAHLLNTQTINVYFLQYFYLFMLLSGNYKYILLVSEIYRTIMNPDKSVKMKFTLIQYYSQ